MDFRLFSFHSWCAVYEAAFELPPKCCDLLHSAGLLEIFIEWLYLEQNKTCTENKTTIVHIFKKAFLSSSTNCLCNSVGYFPWGHLSSERNHWGKKLVLCLIPMVLLICPWINSYMQVFNRQSHHMSLMKKKKKNREKRRCVGAFHDFFKKFK